MTEDELKSILSIGELKSDVVHIKETLVRMERSIETSFSRGGERMGKLEDGQAACDKNTGIMAESIKTIKEDVSDLKDTRKKATWGIIGSYFAALASRFLK